MNDARLLQMLREGKEEGPRALCAQYAPLAAAIARRVLSTRPEDVEEVAADTVLTVWQKRDALRADTLRGFVITTARNLAIDRWRQLWRRQEVPLFGCDQEDTAFLEAGLLGEELQKQILAVLPPDGEIFLRHYVLLESAKEIGAGFGLTESAVRARLHRTRNILRQEVDQNG